MKACLKREIGAVAGEMGRGQHYGGNATGQIIQHQPVGDAQYESLIKEFALGHSSTQQTISNQKNQTQQQAMAMHQLQQQLEMNAAQPWQQRQQQPTQQHQNNNKHSNRGCKSRGNNNNNRNGGGNHPTWSTNIPSRFNRKNTPANVRSNETPKYCWTHGHNTCHTSNECTAQ